ncbi:MAG: secretin N-terminal domain-containing protein [Phycisphaerae bacterium]
MNKVKAISLIVFLAAVLPSLGVESKQEQKRQILEKMKTAMLKPTSAPSEASEIRIYALRKAEADDVARIIRGLFNPDRITEDMRTNSLIVVAPQDIHKKVGKLIDELDQVPDQFPSASNPKLSVSAFHLVHRPVKDVLPLLQNMLTNTSVRVAADEEKNTIFVILHSGQRGVPMDLNTITGLITQLDTPKPQSLQPQVLQINFYFLKGRSAADAGSDAAVRETWKKLQTTVLKDMSAFRDKLSHAFSYFNQQGINLSVQWSKLETEGITPADDVKYGNIVGLKNVNFKAALEILLKTLPGSVGYAVDRNGLLIVSTTDTLPESYQPLPEFLASAGEALDKNGFRNPQLLAQLSVKAQENGKFDTSGFSWADGGGIIQFKVSGKTGSRSEHSIPLEVQAGIHAPVSLLPSGLPLRRRTSTAPASISINYQSTGVITSIVAPFGDYVILAAYPSDPSVEQSIAIVIRVTPNP